MFSHLRTFVDLYDFLMSPYLFKPFEFLAGASYLCAMQAKEIVTLKREVERQKELVSTQEVKAKWHQSKLKVEAETHKASTKLHQHLIDSNEQMHSSSVVRQLAADANGPGFDSPVAQHVQRLNFQALAYRAFCSLVLSWSWARR